MICTKCQLSKDNFPYKNKKKGIRSTICSDCQNEYKKKYYRNNKPDFYERNKKKETLLKEIIQEGKKACIKCGETEKICLDYHHLEDKEFNISRGYKLGSISKLKEEINKCVVLCSNCHRKVHAGIMDM